MPIDGYESKTIDVSKEDTDEEGKDGTTDTTDTEVNEDVNEQSGAADTNGEEAVGEAEEDAGEERGEAQETDDDTGSQKVTVEALQEQIQGLQSALEEKLKTPAEPQPEPQKPVELSDEEWSQKEEQWGVSRNAIKRITAQNVQVFNEVMKRVDDVLAEKLGGIETNNVFSTLSKEKGFEDVGRYRQGMEEFLSKYNVRDRSNPELVKMAFFYSKGRASSGNIKKARNEGERNKRIVGAGRPASPGSGGIRKPVKPLNKMQSDTAARFGMSEEEYRKFKGKAVIGA